MISSYQPLPSSKSHPPPCSSSNINPEDESAPLTGGESSVGPLSGSTGEPMDKFELTNIAVISSSPAPFRNTTTTTTVSCSSGNNAPQPGVPRGSIARDFIVTNGEEKGNWTNFHFIMCVGIVGFFVFWIILLCRMYLPAQFQTWIYGVSSTTESPPPHEGKVLLEDIRAANMSTLSLGSSEAPISFPNEA